MSSSKRKCGPHVELTSNAAARVTRCACGVVHVQLHAQGMSMRLDPEALRHLANALSGASRLVDITDAPRPEPTGDCMN